MARVKCWTVIIIFIIIVVVVAVFVVETNVEFSLYNLSEGTKLGTSDGVLLGSYVGLLLI